MQLEHSFTVPVPVDKAWAVLLDVEQIAPCMPGAALDTVDGDSFTGSVKVKLGPISLTYKGSASFISKDVDNHVAVLDASGRDSRGNGTAAAKVTATLEEEGDATRVDVTTDLNITGKPAQFGRGVMVDVGNKLIGQFADCLAGKLGATDEPAAEPAAEAGAGNGAAASAPPTTDTAPTGNGASAASPPRRVPQQDVQPIDLLEVAGGSVLSRFGPPVAAAVVLLLVFVILRRRRR